MNNYLKLTTAYIKKYKSRSISMCLSMVLSIALIVGVGTLSNSAKQADINKIKYEEGLHHVRYVNLNKSQVDKLEKNKDIKELGISSYYDSSNPDSDLMINLSMANEEYIKLGNSQLINGKFPTKPNEIAIEEWVLKNMGITPEIGQEVSVNLYGKQKEESYKLVGILKDRPKEKSSAIMEGFLAPNKNIMYELDAYVMFDENSDVYGAIQSVAKDINVKSENVRKNGMLLESLGATGNIDYKVVAISIIVAIVSGIVMYGIFNISIMQRTSEYGVIRAIGGSSIQILKLLLFELLILLVVSIPIGIVLGILGGKLFSSISGGLFTEGIVEISKLTIPFDVIIFSVVVVLFTVLAISLITLKNINKVSSIDAIRKNSSSEKIKRNRILTVSRLSKFMSFESIIAFKNILRNKKSFYMIILSMSLGSTLFIVSTFYADLSKEQGEKSAEVSGINTDYKISIIPSKPMNYGISNKDLDELKNLDGVKSVSSIQVLYSRMMLDKSDIAEPRYFEQKNEAPYNKEVLNGLLVNDKNGKDVILKNNVYGYDDKLLKESKKFLLDGKIDINKMKNEDIALIKIPHPLGPNVVDIRVGDKVKITFREDGQSGDEYFRIQDKGGKYITKEFTIGGIVDELIDTTEYHTGTESVDLVLSSDIFKQSTGFENYQILNIDKEKGVDHNNLNDKILDITSKTEGSVVTNLIQERETIGLLQKNKLIFINAIIIILFVISLFNIINNVSYSLISRTNEFGMIRAIGVDNKEFKKVIRFEGLSYGIVASILSVVMGLIGQIVLFTALSPQLISPQFTIQWQSYILIILVNIVIGLISTCLPLRIIKGLSIVESISSLE